MARAYSNLLQSPAPLSFLPFSGVVVSSRSHYPEAEGGIIPRQWCCGEGIQKQLYYSSLQSTLWWLVTCLPSVPPPFTQSCPFCTVLYNRLCRSQLAEAPPFPGKAVRAASLTPFLHRSCDSHMWELCVQNLEAQPCQSIHCYQFGLSRMSLSCIVCSCFWLKPDWQI